jgi:hypothetical protein
MRTSRPGRLLFAGLAAAAIVLGVVSASGAASEALRLTRKQADAAALAVLRPGSQGRYAVVYGYPAALPAETTVSAAGPGPGQRWRALRRSTGSELTAVVPRTRLKALGWLFWDDPRAGAEFPHPSRLLLLDGASGKVLWTRTIDWYPLVNDKTAAFYRSYRSPNYVVFARGAAVVRGLRMPAAAAVPRATPAAYKDACLVTVADPSYANDGANFSGDAKAMLKLASKYGIEGTNRTGSAGSAEGLDEEVGRLIGNGCKDVIVLVAGHGAPAEGAGATAEPTVAIATHVEPTPDGNGTMVVDKTITASELKAVVAKYKAKADFKFFIDSCFSGRFATALGNEDGVRFVGTSSQADELSVMSTSADAASDHTDGATLYISGFVQEFEKIQSGKEENVDEQTVQAAKDDLVFALTLAADHAGLKGTGTDKAAARGLTRPAVVKNPKGGGQGGSTLESEYSFSGLEVQFARPAGLYGQDAGFTTETFAGTSCGHNPLEGAWTITATNSYSPEGVVHPPITAIADFSKTNPFAIDPMELITNPGGTATPNGTIVATATTTIALNEAAETMEASVSVTGEFRAPYGGSVPIRATLLPKGKSCP